MFSKKKRAKGHVFIKGTRLSANTTFAFNLSPRIQTYALMSMAQGIRNIR